MCLFSHVILLFLLLLHLFIHLINNFNAFSMTNSVNGIEYLFVTGIVYFTKGYRFYAGVFIKLFYLS